MAHNPNGLSHSEWLALELRKEREEREVPLTLDPPYPYTVKLFDPEAFGLLNAES